MEGSRSAWILSLRRDDGSDGWRWKLARAPSSLDLIGDLPKVRSGHSKQSPCRRAAPARMQVMAFESAGGRLKDLRGVAASLSPFSHPLGAAPDPAWRRVDAGEGGLRASVHWPPVQLS